MLYLLFILELQLLLLLLLLLLVLTWRHPRIVLLLQASFVLCHFKLLLLLLVVLLMTPTAVEITFQPLLNIAIWLRGELVGCIPGFADCQALRAAIAARTS
jgi:hypothetical protein